MALEFKTRDASYKGPVVFPNGSALSRVAVFVDHLPPGFSTAHYNPYLVNDSYSHRPRYVIDAYIAVYDNNLLIFRGVSATGRSDFNPKTIQVVPTNSIGNEGLDVLLVHDGHTYQGTVYPIPELTAEAPQQRLAKQRRLVQDIIMGLRICSQTCSLLTASL